MPRFSLCIYLLLFAGLGPEQAGQAASSTSSMAMITSLQAVKGRWLVKGVTQDNGAVASILVNEQPATIVATHAGVIDWAITIRRPPDRTIRAAATDQAGNRETTAHVRQWDGR
jgi:hypothetical protein